MAFRTIGYAMLLITVVLSISAVAPAQQQTENRIIAAVNRTKAEVRFTDLLARARSGKPAGFSLMPVSGTVSPSAPAITITPLAAAANLQVIGGGTLGRLTKWTGFTSGNSVIGNSTIFEDKFGMVGIGTDSPTSKLTVQGLIETQLGGYRFPDGTIQTTAGVAPNQVVNSLNGLTGQVVLGAGSNITITPNGKTLTIASSTQDPALSAFQAQVDLFFSGHSAILEPITVVPANKRLVIEYVTVRLRTDDYIDICSLNTTVNGSLVSHSVVPIRLPEPSTTTFIADKQVRIYADAGSEVSVFINRTSTQGEGFVIVTISGHLVDIP